MLPLYRRSNRSKGLGGRNNTMHLDRCKEGWSEGRQSELPQPRNLRQSSNATCAMGATCTCQILQHPYKFSPLFPALQIQSLSHSEGESPVQVCTAEQGQCQDSSLDWLSLTPHSVPVPVTNTGPNLHSWKLCG